MKKLLSCAFNMDTGCVELRYSNGGMYSIDCTAVENEVARNMYERSELDYLIYNDPIVQIWCSMGIWNRISEM